MFEPHLDNGSEYQTVGVVSSPTGLFGYMPEVELNFRTDALLVAVTMDTTRDTWELAGSMVQLWEVGGNSYQTKYSKVWLKQKTIVPVEPLESSILIFNPVTWLKNWTIDIKARPYLNPYLDREDFSEIDESFSLLLQQTSIGFSDLRSNLSDTFASGTAQRADIATTLSEINQKLTELLLRQQET
jgi:hypothetical protein